MVNFQSGTKSLEKFSWISSLLKQNIAGRETQKCRSLSEVIFYLGQVLPWFKLSILVIIDINSKIKFENNKHNII